MFTHHARSIQYFLTYFIRIYPNSFSAFFLEITVIFLLLSFLYGAAWAGASLIWKLENWSLLRQTITHLVICSGLTFPVAYVCHWMAHNIISVICYFAIFFGIYIAIWVSQYIAMKVKISKMNEKIKR